MTEMREPGTSAGPRPGAQAEVPRQRTEQPTPTSTGWVGWVYFAAIMALVGGVFQLVAGFTAVFREGYYLVSRNGLVVHWTYNEWGWIHVGIGALLVLVGLGLFAGQTWARVVAIAIAAVSALANFAFMAAYPAWSIVLIAIDVLVIYALAAHGREVKY